MLYTFPPAVLGGRLFLGPLEGTEIKRVVHFMRNPTIATNGCKEIATRTQISACSVPRSWLKPLLSQRVHLLLAILSLSIIIPLLTACGGNTGLWQQDDT